MMDTEQEQERRIAQLQYEDNLKQVCLYLNVLIEGFGATVRARLSGKDCLIVQLVPVKDKIEVYDDPLHLLGTFPGDTIFTIQLKREA